MGMILKDVDGNPIFWPDTPELVIDPDTKEPFVRCGNQTNNLTMDDWAGKAFIVRVVNGKVVVDVVDERDIS